MAALGLPGTESLVREKIEKEHKTHREILEELKLMYPTQRGLSIKSLQHFCSTHSIHRTSRIDESCYRKTMGRNKLSNQLSY